MHIDITKKIIILKLNLVLFAVACLGVSSLCLISKTRRHFVRDFVVEYCSRCTCIQKYRYTKKSIYFIKNINRYEIYKTGLSGTTREIFSYFRAV